MMIQRFARAWAFTRLVGSTFLAYARLAHLILRERMWSIPQRQRRELVPMTSRYREMLP